MGCILFVVWASTKKSTIYSNHQLADIPAKVPFCTIDPTETRAFLEDERFDWLVAQHKPKSEVKAGRRGNSSNSIEYQGVEFMEWNIVEPSEMMPIELGQLDMINWMTFQEEQHDAPQELFI